MKVHLTTEAMYDISDMADYIEEDFGEDRAFQFEIEIEQRFDHLERYTHVYTGIRYRGNKIYKDVFSPSLIFFTIVGDSIHVLRVLREERDWHRLLREKQHYRYL